MNHILNKEEDLQDLINEYICIKLNEVNLEFKENDIQQALFNVDNTFPKIIKDSCEHLDTYRYPIRFRDKLGIIKFGKHEVPNTYEIEINFYTETKNNLILFIWLDSKDNVIYSFDQKVEDKNKQFMLDSFGAWLLHINDFRYKYISVFKNI